MVVAKVFDAGRKVVLVTGGSSGIGRMAAEAFAAAGARVLIVSRREEACIDAADAINARGYPGLVEGFGGDVSSAAGVRRIVDEVALRTSRLDVLVNNAGRSWGAAFDDFPFEAWQKVMDLNVAGLFTLTRDLVPLLSRDPGESPGRVINIGSVMGSANLSDHAWSYAASKAAVHHLTRILAKELASRNITVNAVAPGPFESRMTAFALRDAGEASVAAGVPLGRVGRPDDIAGAMLFLAGSGGSYVTGAIIPVDGGIGVQTGPDIFESAR